MRVTIPFLIVGLLAQAAAAECVYFRVSAKLLHCAPADMKALDALDPYHASEQAPELEEAKAANLLQVICTCEYSLQGSDQRCDMDQTVEKSSVIAPDDDAHSCRRGNLICRDVCPPRLPS